MNPTRTIRFSCLRIFFATFAVAVLSASASAQISLATVVDLAQRNSASVRLAITDVQKAAAQLSQSQGAFMPAVSFGSGLPAFPQVGFTGSLPTIWDGSVQSMVFSWPQIRTIQAARASLQAAQLSLKDVKESVALDASVAYIELDTVNRQLEAARQQEQNANRLVAIEQQRSEAGVDPLSTLLQARLTEAQLRLSRIHLESRSASLKKQLAELSGLPASSILPDPASIPAIPAVTADKALSTPAIEAAQALAFARKRIADSNSVHARYLPEVSFGSIYNRNTTLLNDINSYYARHLPANNYSSGFSIRLPLFDMNVRGKARETAADALRAKVEAEQAEHQNDLRIAELSNSLRELDTQAEIASLKQQISAEQLKTVLTQLETGNGATNAPGAPPQLTPAAEQQARIDERQKYLDSLDSALDLGKARLNLLRALGHMQDWLDELHAK